MASRTVLRMAPVVSIMRIRILFSGTTVGLLLLGLRLSSCRTPSPLSQDEGERELSAKEIIAIAECEASKRFGQAIEVGRAVLIDDHWVVSAWNLPVKPGGHVVYRISKNGEILAVSPGL